MATSGDFCVATDNPSARFPGDGAFHTGGGDICRMAHKL